MSDPANRKPLSRRKFLLGTAAIAAIPVAARAQQGYPQYPPQAPYPGPQPYPQQYPGERPYYPGRQQPGANQRPIQNSAAYTFQVAAQNVAGTGLPSATSNAAAPSPTYPWVAVSDRQYSLASNNGAAWTDMDPNYLNLSVTPLVDSQAILTGNADLWTANATINQDIGIAVSGGATSPIYPTTPGQPEAWKESGGFAGTFSPNAAAVQTVRLLKAGVTYTVKLQWKTNKSANGTTIFAGAGPIGSDFSPTRLTVQLVPATPVTVATSSSSSQFVLTNNNGSTWTDLGPSSDPTITLTPPTTGALVVSGNADLWTATGGINQDLGITASGGTGANTYPSTAGQPEAWKESGGYAGTQSPNAAFVQAVLPVIGGTPVTLKLQWKTNKNLAATVVGGAGPIGSAYSPTRLSAWFVPSTGPVSVQDAVIATQRQLGANNGSDWADVDAANLSLSITKTSDCLALLSGNADLWTASAGYNQDLGIIVSSSNGIVAPDRVGWKESGGFAGTYSPNAAFAQTMFPIAANTTYTAKLDWKGNKAVAAGTIFAGAGPVGSRFSPTRLTAVVYCVPAPVITSVSPTSGYTGTSVTINGTNLTGATVKFGTQPASVTSSSDTQLTVSPPKQTLGTVVDVTATTGGGTSATSTADRFTYSYAGAVLADSPNIYYRLGESSGTTASDSSGNSHDATYSATGVTLGAAGAIVNDPDTAVTLDGTAGKVQETTGAGTPTGSSARSVEAWFKTSLTTAEPIVAYGTAATVNGYFAVYVHNTNVEVQVGGTTVTFTGTTALANAAWHHLVVTYSATSLTAYIDGAIYGVQTLAAPLATALDANGLRIGEDNAAVPAFFTGSLDEVAIYPTVLTSSQVSNHDRAGTAN